MLIKKLGWIKEKKLKVEYHRYAGVLSVFERIGKAGTGVGEVVFHLVWCRHM